MATPDLPPVLEPIQVDFDFSRIVGMTTGTGSTGETGAEFESEPWTGGLEPEPESVDDRDVCSSFELEQPVQTNEQPAGQRHVEAPASRGTVSTEESPLPGHSGLTFDEMVERALAEGGGSPFGVQQLSGHFEGRRSRPPPQTSGVVDRPLDSVGSSGSPLPTQACDAAGTPRRGVVDEEMQEFIGLEERLRRGDELTEEEQMLCRTPITLPAGDSVASGVPDVVGSDARPADARLNAALAWAGLGDDRDHDIGTECVAHLHAHIRRHRGVAPPLLYARR